MGCPVYIFTRLAPRHSGRAFGNIMKRWLVIALVLVVTGVGAFLLLRSGSDVVAIYGDGRVELNSRRIEIQSLATRHFKGPVVIRTFTDTSPVVMNHVLDALAAAGADADFEDGKYMGQRPDLSK